MSRLHDDEGRALVDLHVPRSDEPQIGTWVPAGTLIPEELREAVTAMERESRKPAKGR